MSTSTVRFHKVPAVCGAYLRPQGLLPVVCTLVVSLGLTAPIRAQDPSLANPTALNDWIQDARDGASHDAIEFLFDNVTMEPSSIEWGKTVNTDNLQMASWQCVFSALSVWSYADQLDSTQAKIESARAAAQDLQSQLTQTRSTIGAQQSASIVEIEANLKLANFSLKQAMADHVYLESRLATAESDLRQARFEVSNSRRGLIYFNQVAPRGDFAVGIAQRAMPWIGLGQEGFDLAANPVYRSQPAELNYRAKKLGFDLGSALAIAVDESLADVLAPPSALYELHEKLHNLQLAITAREHQRESEALAFGGVLSTANTPKFQFTRDYDNFSGSFRSTQSSGPLSVTGVWVSRSDKSFDRFSTAGRYTFSGLETPSGHILTGYGMASRYRTEQHDTSFDLLSGFEFGDNRAVTETTRRHESYNDSFNGALANQKIRRATEFNSHPNISAAPSAAIFPGQHNLKRPPTVYSPPPSPPRPIPVPLGDQGSSKRARSVIIPPPLSPPSQPTSPGDSKAAPGGIYLGGKAKYSKLPGTEKEVDDALGGAEVIPAKKKTPPQ